MSKVKAIFGLAWYQSTHKKKAKSASGTHSRTLRSLSNDEKVAVKRATKTECLSANRSGGQDLENANHVSRSGRERERVHFLAIKRKSNVQSEPIFALHTGVEQEK